MCNAVCVNCSFVKWYKLPSTLTDSFSTAGDYIVMHLSMSTPLRWAMMEVRICKDKTTKFPPLGQFLIIPPFRLRQRWGSSPFRLILHSESGGANFSIKCPTWGGWGRH